AIELALDVVVDDANVVLKNSGLVTRLRLVGFVAYLEANADSPSQSLGTLSDILDAMQNGSGGNFYQQGWYTAAHLLRDSFGADLVQAIPNVSDTSLAGIASLFTTDPEDAYSVVDAEFLGDYVPAHEFGHGFGACHAVGDGGGCDPDGG